MAQRCGLCGKTEKQHKGRTCVDPVLAAIAKQIKDGIKAAESQDNDSAQKVEDDSWAV